jgi:hypothetical protein
MHTRNFAPVANSATVTAAVPATLWGVDALKSIAAQLILWHHFVIYGPLPKTIYPHLSGLFEWLNTDARQAVQVFLVVGGFLAARALAPTPATISARITHGSVLKMIGGRYLRLIRPYGVMLIVAVLCAAAARGLMNDSDTPAAPALWQGLAHLLLLQDILGVDALSAGVWYVAIDLQLYTLLIVLLRGAQVFPAQRNDMTVILFCVGLTLAALLVFNLDKKMDVWGVYFFGAYGLGIMTHWAIASPHRSRWIIGLAALVVLALLVAWRERIVWAAATALFLIASSGGKWAPPHSIRAVLASLGQTSYAVFLLHYPICLLVGALIASRWPGSLVASASGLLAAWLLSMLCGGLLYRHAEKPATRSGRSAPPVSL